MGLYENMNAEPVSELELRKPALAKPEQTIREVILAMRQRRIGCVIVVDDAQHPVGMFTESMLTHLIAANPASVDDTVGQHAAEHWPQVKTTDPVVSVLDALEMKNVRFLAVVDDDGRVAGLTGQKGLMEYVAEHFPGQVMVQRIGQKPYIHQREGA